MSMQSSYNNRLKTKRIWGNMIYTKKTKDHLLGLYYLVLWKDYSKAENIWEPITAI